MVQAPVPIAMAPVVPATPPVTQGLGQQGDAKQMVGGVVMTLGLMCFLGGVQLKSPGMVFYGFLPFWVGFALLSAPKSSMIVAVGGGFMASCVALAIALQLLPTFATASRTNSRYPSTPPTQPCLQNLPRSE